MKVQSISWNYSSAVVKTIKMKVALSKHFKEYTSSRDLVDTGQIEKVLSLPLKYNIEKLIMQGIQNVRCKKQGKNGDWIKQYLLIQS